MPRRCEHGARNEETYLEIIDGLNKEKPMPEAWSLRQLSPNCGPPFLPLRQKRTDVGANYVLPPRKPQG